MAGASENTPVAALVSGGIDSAVLVAELCSSYTRVFPLFLRGGLFWEEAELEHLQSFLREFAPPELQALKVLDQPVRDVYGDHWSVTGRGVPRADTADDAVFLPGRNLFLLTKAAAWCALNHVEVLALGTLSANPFPDSTPEFDDRVAQLVHDALSVSVRITRPFLRLTKAEVLRRGANLPLERTFSCIQPVRGKHCGMCNKCAERRGGFEEAGLTDRTVYADGMR